MKDYCGDGFDAVEECLRKELLVAEETEGDFASLSQKTHECLQVLYTRLLAAVEENFVRIEEVATERFFNVPVGLLSARDTTSAGEGAATLQGEGNEDLSARAMTEGGVESGRDASVRVVHMGEEDERRLDEQLRDLRCRIGMENGVASAAREESGALERELRACQQTLHNLRSAAKAQKENDGGSNGGKHLLPLVKRLFELLHRSTEVQKETVLLDRWGRPGSGTAEAQIHQHQTRAGNVSADALQNLDNILSSG